MTTAVPKTLNLGSIKPTTIPAYTRRVESIATNAQEFGENGIANIVIDTSTPGSFLDPVQSLLQFDITIENTNPYIDYLNLSSSGMAAIIQEMRIICQGTPIEEILDYNLMFEMFMDLGGHAQEEFKMYFENSWRAPTLPGQSDLNFVKPPMVDREGVIMCPNAINTFGDGNLISSHCEEGNYLISFENITGPNPDLTNPYANLRFEPNRGLGVNGINTKTEANGDKDSYNGYTPTATDGSSFNQRGPGSGLHSRAIGSAYADNVGTGGNYIHPYETAVDRWQGCTAPGNIRSQTWTNRIDNTYVTWPSTIRPEPFAKSETRQRNEADARQYRVQDYFQYLANVKNIPIGIAPHKSFVTNEQGLNRSFSSAVGTPAGEGEVKIANWNFTNTAAHMTGKSSTTYSISLPIFSGIIGLWAEKQFPTMLISPGSFYIQIKFAKAAQAFQCAMDPCRRVFGTYRDYVPNAGLPTYYKTEYRGQNLDSTKMATIAATTGAAGSATYMALTTAGTLGWDYAWQGYLALLPGTCASAATLSYRLDNNNANTGNGFRNNLFANTTSTTVAGGGIATDLSLIGNSAAKVGGNFLAPGAAGAEVYSSNFVGQGEGFTTGNAKPQYVPRRTPWLSGGNGFADGWCDATLGGTAPPYASNNTSSAAAYVRERDSCFGTYLPCSTAQVRRTTPATNTLIGATNLDKLPTYTVKNLKYVGQQTILPDEVTASIVRTAASSDISLHAQSCRTYRTIMSNSSTQNLILPVKVASANSMWMVFQNQKLIENSNYCSLTRTCPFTSFQWTPDSKYSVGSDTAPSVKGVGTGSNAFNIQLRIGNELLPMQPINTMQQVLLELVRSIHGTGDMDTNLPMFGSIKSDYALSSVNTNSINSTTNHFSMLKNNEFCTPFIPIEAIDDQTITNNPLFMDYLQYGQTIVSDGKSISTHTSVGGASSNQFNDRGRYVLPAFLPPISKFLLGFDLDTFPGTNDTARSGKYLGNAPLTLQMTNTVACNTPTISGGQQDSIIATAVVLHDIRFSIMAGGQILSYY